jgi:hypothetical protein
LFFCFGRCVSCAGKEIIKLTCRLNTAVSCSNGVSPIILLFQRSAVRTHHAMIFQRYDALSRYVSPHLSCFSNPSQSILAFILLNTVT